MRPLFRTRSPIRGLLAAVTFASIALLPACSAPWSPGHTAIHYSNPVFDQELADPTVLRTGSHDYWAYGTISPPGWQKHSGWNFPILHSTDLARWRYLGDAFSKQPAWTGGDLWAPDVVQRGRRYYLFYVGQGMGSGKHCIAVATATSPKGPFTTRNIIGCGDATSSGYIDPAVFIDADGRAYLYVSVDDPEHNISVIPLQGDLLHAAGPRVALFGVTQAWEYSPTGPHVENPFLIQHEDLYYLFFSGGRLEDNYAMGYATAQSPLGPFTVYEGNPILRGTKQISAPGGGSVVEGPDDNLWMVYHAWDTPGGYEAGGKRVMFIDPIVWDGSTPTVRPTRGSQSSG